MRMKAVLARERTQSSLNLVVMGLDLSKIPVHTLAKSGTFLSCSCSILNAITSNVLKWILFSSLIRDFEKGNGMVKPELLEERIFNSITWAPRIWVGDRYAEYDWGFSYGYWSGSKQIKEDELSETAIYSNYLWYIYHKKGEVQETDSDFLQSGTMQYQTRDISFKEEGFFRISQLIWDLRDPFFFPIQR
ncbi:hypothetical protein ACJX0J_004356 (mitochondrion) [Zea mays]